MLDNTPHQPTKCRTKNWVKINDESRGTYNTNTQVRFETSILRSILCEISGNVTITGAGNDNEARRLDQRNKGVIFKNSAPFTDYISEINDR